MLFSLLHALSWFPLALGFARDNLQQKTWTVFVNYCGYNMYTVVSTHTCVEIIRPSGSLNITVDANASPQLPHSSNYYCCALIDTCSFIYSVRGNPLDASTMHLDIRRHAALINWCTCMSLLARRYGHALVHCLGFV